MLSDDDVDVLDMLDASEVFDEYAYFSDTCKWSERDRSTALEDAMSGSRNIG